MNDDAASVYVRGCAASAFGATIISNDHEQADCADRAFSALSSILEKTETDIDGIGRRITDLFCTLCSSSMSNLHAAVGILKACLLRKTPGTETLSATRLLPMKILQAIHDSSVVAAGFIGATILGDPAALGELHLCLHPAMSVYLDDASKCTALYLLKSIAGLDDVHAGTRRILQRLLEYDAARDAVGSSSSAFGGDVVVLVPCCQTGFSFKRLLTITAAVSPGSDVCPACRRCLTTAIAELHWGNPAVGV